MKYIHLHLVLLCMFCYRAFAYDFRAENVDGVTIFYNLINDGKELQVTNLNGNISYWGKVAIPSDHGVGSPDHSGISYGVIQKLKNDQENRPRVLS